MYPAYLRTYVVFTVKNITHEDHMLQILCMYVQNVLSKDLEDSRITERKLLAASAVFLIHFITNLVKCMNAQVTHKPIVRNMLHT